MKLSQHLKQTYHDGHCNDGEQCTEYIQGTRMRCIPVVYSCAMDVTVAQAGVMADRNTVMRIALPSAIQVDAWMTLRRSNTTIGTASRRSATGR